MFGKVQARLPPFCTEFPWLTTAFRCILTCQVGLLTRQEQLTVMRLNNCHFLHGSQAQLNCPTGENCTGQYRLLNPTVKVQQALVVQRLDNAIHQTNYYPVDSVVCFVNTYPLDGDLSGGWCYPPFEQLGPTPDVRVRVIFVGVDLTGRDKIYFKPVGLAYHGTKVDSPCWPGPDTTKHRK